MLLALGTGARTITAAEVDRHVVTPPWCFLDGDTIGEDYLRLPTFPNIPGNLKKERRDRADYAHIWRQQRPTPLVWRELEARTLQASDRPSQIGLLAGSIGHA